MEWSYLNKFVRSRIFKVKTFGVLGGKDEHSEEVEKSRTLGGQMIVRRHVLSAKQCNIGTACVRKELNCYNTILQLALSHKNIHINCPGKCGSVGWSIILYTKMLLI